MTKNESIKKILSTLKKIYPKASIMLKYSNNFELLVAVILSAQCTDIRVNIVTEKLFKKYRKIEDYANANIAELKKYIYSAGFYNNKAKNIIAAAKLIIAEYNGEVPNTMEKLLKVPGVARKTANVVLFNAFNKQEGIAVDTHVHRLSNRLGLSKQSSPEKIEKDLMKIVPKIEWGRLTYLLIEHGRAICIARKPKCGVCGLRKLCNYN